MKRKPNSFCIDCSTPIFVGFNCYSKLCQTCRKKRNRIAGLRKKYDMSVEEYDDILIEQLGVCAICRTRGQRRLAVDHNHRTGAIRGLLCARCNMGIGCFKDDVAKLKGAISYLERSAPT